MRGPTKCEARGEAPFKGLAAWDLGRLVAVAPIGLLMLADAPSAELGSESRSS